MKTISSAKSESTAIVRQEPPSRQEPVPQPLQRPPLPLTKVPSADSKAA